MQQRQRRFYGSFHGGVQQQNVRRTGSGDQTGNRAGGRTGERVKSSYIKKENVDLFDDMLADYSKDHPGVTFKQTSGKQENLLTLISTNEVPDIMNVWPMNSLFREMMKEGVFMDLSGSEVLANVPENILEACRYDGKDYSVPISVNSYSMFTIQSYLKKKDLLIQRQKMSSGLCAIHLKAEVSRQSPLEIRISACSRDILHVCLQEQLPMMQKRSQRL